MSRTHHCSNDNTQMNGAIECTKTNRSRGFSNVKGTSAVPRVTQPQAPAQKEEFCDSAGVTVEGMGLRSWETISGLHGLHSQELQVKLWKVRSQ